MVPTKWKRSIRSYDTNAIKLAIEILTGHFVHINRRRANIFFLNFVVLTRMMRVQLVVLYGNENTKHLTHKFRLDNVKC